MAAVPAGARVGGDVSATKLPCCAIWEVSPIWEVSRDYEVHIVYDEFKWLELQRFACIAAAVVPVVTYVKSCMPPQMLVSGIVTLGLVTAR